MPNSAFVANFFARSKILRVYTPVYWSIYFFFFSPSPGLIFLCCAVNINQTLRFWRFGLRFGRFYCERNRRWEEEIDHQENPVSFLMSLTLSLYSLWLYSLYSLSLYSLPHSLSLYSLTHSLYSLSQRPLSHSLTLLSHSLPLYSLYSLLPLLTLLALLTPLTLNFHSRTHIKKGL